VAADGKLALAKEGGNFPGDSALVEATIAGLLTK
jgi:hypothetical protein